MKTIFKITIMLLLLVSSSVYGQRGIGTNTPDTSAILELASTSKGFLPPRMTASQRDAIATPGLGLIIFCTDCAYGEGELQIKFSSAWKSLTSGNVNDQTISDLAIGDTFQGGVVFYLDGSGRGLIAAFSDQSDGLQWYNGSNVTTNATGTAIGTGSANTDAIIAVQGTTQTDYAAGLTRAYNGSGYTDWFLPSKDALNQMYLNKDALEANAGFNAFSNDAYMSSTELGADEASVQHFNNGNAQGQDKDSEDSVRAVRAF
tara:strand:+ start:68 stop:847 length:780 start_codon:yes stop_codon:yes gene_type:complete